MKLTLPTDSAARKDVPVARGPLAYFPAAIAGVAVVCDAGNKKHNPGEPLHHARGKSTDHADCIVRHLMDVQDIAAYIERGGDHCAIAVLLTEANQLAWRALALSQELHEMYGDVPLAPGAREPDRSQPVKTPDIERSEPVVLIDYSHELPPAQCKAVRNTGFPLEFCSLPEDHEGDHVGPFHNWTAVAFPQEQAAVLADEIVGRITCADALHGPAGADWRAPNVQWPRG